MRRYLDTMGETGVYSFPPECNICNVTLIENFLINLRN